MELESRRADRSGALRAFESINPAHQERPERARERPERRERRVSRVRPPELSLPVKNVSTALGSPCLGDLLRV